MDEKNLSMNKIFICQKQQWMEKYSPWMKVSSMEKMGDNFSICGCHRWMKNTNKKTVNAH